MYKVEKCGDEFWCILDVQTTMPPLLSFRWLESQLKENALGTQKSYNVSDKLLKSVPNGKSVVISKSHQVTL